jgi:hypothetical protein
MKAILTVGFLQEVEGTEQELNIDEIEIYLHEQYNKNMCLNNDIALVKVKGLGIQLGPHITPACLPRYGVQYTK